MNTCIACAKLKHKSFCSSVLDTGYNAALPLAEHLLADWLSQEILGKYLFSFMDTENSNWGSPLAQVAELFRETSSCHVKRVVCDHGKQNPWVLKFLGVKLSMAFPVRQTEHGRRVNILQGGTCDACPCERLTGVYYDSEKYYTAFWRNTLLSLSLS